MDNEKVMKKKRILKWIAGIAILAIGVSLFCYTVYAVFDEETAVHIKADEIEESTLIIGTHLIHISALNDELYVTAEESASDSNQTSVYYKSELAGGSWYDITNASSLSDITAESTPVDKSVIEELFLTHHTKSDKVTYDLLTGESVSPFDIKDPYDITGLKELEPLKIQFDIIDKNPDRTDSDDYTYDCIRALYNAELHNEVTNECDIQIEALQKYYDELAAAEAPMDELDELTAVMKAVDAARRAEVMNIVMGVPMDAFMMNITGTNPAEIGEGTDEEGTGDENAGGEEGVGDENTSGEEGVGDENTSGEEGAGDENASGEEGNADGEEEAGEVNAGGEEDVTEIDENAGTGQTMEDGNLTTTGQPEDLLSLYAPSVSKPNDFVINNEVVSAAGDALGNVQESYTTHSGNMLKQGLTIISKEKYQTSTALIENAVKNEYKSCDDCIDKLIDIKNIGAGAISNKDRERDYLRDSLIKKGEDLYFNFINKGASAEYKAAAADSKTSSAVMKKLLKTQTNEANSYRLELQFFISALSERLTNAEGQTDIGERIVFANTLSGTVKEDEFAADAKTTINEYQTWLGQLLADLVKAAGDSELDLLADQKADYQEKLMECLDNNDLAGAKRYEAMVDAVDQKIEEAGGDSGISELADGILAAVKNGDMDEAKELMDAISELAPLYPKDATNILNDLADKLQNIEESGSGAGTGDDGTGGDGTGGDGTGGDGTSGTSLDSGIGDLIDGAFGIMAENEEFLVDTLSADALMNLLNSLLGDFGSLDPNAKASVLIAIHMYAEHSNLEEIAQLAARLTEQTYNEGNIYLYRQPMGSYTEFVSTQTLGKVTKYRYIFDNSRQEAILTRAGDFFRFRAYSNTVERPEDKTEEMACETAFLSTVYIEEEYSNTQFGYQAVYIIDSEYSVAANAAMMNTAVEIFNQILDAIGG